MIRKVFRSGNSLVIALPGEALDRLHIGEGSEIDVRLDVENAVLILAPVFKEDAGITFEFAKHVEKFLETYRPALEELSKR